MFRTRTGQTGPDAYQNEAAAIANAQRELDAQAARLATVMVEELPEDVTVLMGIPSTRFPDATVPADRAALALIIKMNGTAGDARYLGEIARALRDPAYVIRH